MTEVDFALVTMFFALKLADAWTAIEILKQGGTMKNKFMAFLFYRFGIVPSLIATKAMAVAIFIILSIRGGDHATFVLVALCALYVYVVAHNLGELD